MSSRRRSNHPPPTWRASSKPKADTSVSVIFAQPLQGLPLRSAIDNLPAIGIDDSASFISEMSRKRERRASELEDESSIGIQKELNGAEGVGSRRGSFHTGTADTPAQDASSGQAAKFIDLTVDDTEAPNISAVLSESPKTAPEFLSPPTPAPTISLPAPSVALQPADAYPKRLSWFASFSRPRETFSVVPQQATGEQAQGPVRADVPPSSAIDHEVAAIEGSLATPALAVNRTQSDPSSAPTQSAASTSPQPIPVSSPLLNRTTSPPPQIATTSHSTSISSVDEEVPPPKPGLTSGLVSESSPAVLQSQDSSAIGRKPSVSSLNPSASRFMLRIPLLGRPKVPLDQAVAANKEVGSASEVVEVIVAEPPGRRDAEPLSQSQPMNDTSGSMELDVPPLPASVSDRQSMASPDSADERAPRAGDHAASSWWSYLGMGGSTINAPVPEGTVGAKVETTTPNVPQQEAQPSESTACESQVGPSPSAMAAPEISDDSLESQENNVQIQITTSGSDDKPQSLLSADTTQTQGSAWYSPWGWYTSSPAAPSPDLGGLQQTTASPSESDDTAKTESEMVKDEALARDDPPPTPPSQTENASAGVVVLPSPNPSSNPIESSISTHRSGWTSFFMSRALLVKSITDDNIKRDENGMEVMDIDEDEDHDGADAAGLPSSPRSVVSASGQTQPAPPKSPAPSTQREAKRPGSVAPPLTNSDSVKKETTKATAPRSNSPAPSTKRSGTSTPVVPKPQPPNLVLPTWSDTFDFPPRSNVPPVPSPPKSTLSKTLAAVSGVLFATESQAQKSAKGKERQSERDFMLFGKELPKTFGVLGQSLDLNLLSGNCRIVVIGVAGWSPGAVTRTIAGGLPSSSSKFVNMTCTALAKFEEENGVKFKKVTGIPLEGDGTILRKVSKVHAHLLQNSEWMEDLRAADVIFVATHSQGSIVSAHLLDKLIREGHILTPRNVDILNSTVAAIAPGGSIPASASRTQKICCLDLCGIHLGPLRYLKTSSLLQPYIQYFENAAARELFDFQDTETATSKEYIKALRTVMDHGAKMVFVASLNDQVVPIYSGLFTAASHPRILRALYIDGDAYHSSDFLSNLLVLLIKIMNTGLSDSGLLAHLSEATAGTLSGIGHSTAYEELSTYSLAVNYLFLTNDGADVRTDLVIEPFNAVNEQNDYEIPWSLRDLIADERVAHFFAQEFAQLRDAFDEWAPRTSILRDIKRKLQPIQRLSSIKGGSYSRL